MRHFMDKTVKPWPQPSWA